MGWATTWAMGWAIIELIEIIGQKGTIAHIAHLVLLRGKVRGGEEGRAAEEAAARLATRAEGGALAIWRN